MFDNEYYDQSHNISCEIPQQSPADVSMDMEVDPHCYSSDNADESLSDSDNDFVESNKQLPYSNLAEALLYFYVNFNISDAAMYFLLSVLCVYGVNVPPTIYRLKNTSVVAVKADFYNKDYVYFGIIEGLTRLINKGITLSSNALRLVFHFDVLPLFRSSSVNIWPILCKVRCNAVSYIFPVSFYCGLTKPNLNFYTEKFARELRSVRNNGFKINNVDYVLENTLLLLIRQVKALSWEQKCTPATIVVHIAKFTANITKDVLFLYEKVLQGQIPTNSYLLLSSPAITFCVIFQCIVCKRAT